MEPRCLYIGCNRSVEYTCSCCRSTLFCSYHFIKHMNEPGTHKEIRIQDGKQELSTRVNLATEVLKEDNQSFVKSGEKLINEIRSSIMEVNNSIEERKGFISKTAAMKPLDEDTDKLIESAITHKFKDESTEEYDQNLNTDLELIKSPNQKNFNKMIFLFIYYYYLHFGLLAVILFI